MEHPTSTSIQKNLTDIQNNVERARGNIQYTHQQPTFQNFESTARLAALIANEIGRVATSIQVYAHQQRQALNFAIPDAIFTQLQEVMNSAESSRTLIVGGIQAARAYTYPEAMLHYTEQVAGTLDGVARLREQLVHVMNTIQSLTEAAEQFQRDRQAQQQAAKQAEEQQQRVLQAQQQAAKQAEQERKAYLAQFGGIDPAEVIAHVQAGTYLSEPAGIITRKGETVLWGTAATLSEDRTTSKYVGGSSGISVPMGHGFRFRVGSYQGHTIHSERLTQIDQGKLIITTGRLIFVGGKSTITILVAKVLHTILYKDGVDVRAENRKKREVFLCPQPMLTNTFILIACHLLSV